MGYSSNLGNAGELAFNPADYGFQPGVTYYLDQYDPGLVGMGPVTYHPSPNLGGNPGLSPWGWLGVTVPYEIPIRPGVGNVVRGRRSQTPGTWNYNVILRGQSDLEEVVRALQPGAQADGTLPHLSVLLDNGLIPQGQSSTPTFDARPFDPRCDPVMHDRAISDYAFGRITMAQLVQIAQQCLAAGGELDPTRWNEQRIPGWTMIDGVPRISRTGDGTITTGGGTIVDAPSGGTTELPRSDRDPSDQCPEGYYLHNGRCYAPWDPFGPEHDPDAVPPGPGDPPPPPSGEPPPPASSSGPPLLVWGAAGLVLALILGRASK